ncbi:unnamed protein product [Tuber melanosporum]|uniref:(Perigord truffle) hypothetical protein n=1 Tax=Tuber melanosporum (strain Mel28) TaxID=656061 RepID=D5GPT6_TUBMM|nr:uncharacterized protein GSTUM_00012025001 [Tuber melanosporum]CAZ86529.1 unnamed protein product [Tuber melanosporum]
MPYRWRCCKCDNGWMTVQAEKNVCTWSECQHVKCNGCDQRNMAAPLYSGGDIIKDITGGGGGRGIGGFAASGGGCCGHFISVSDAEIALGGDDQGSRVLKRSSGTALDHSSLILVPSPIDDEEDEDISHGSSNPTIPEDEDGLVPRPSCSGKCLLRAKQAIIATYPLC